MYTNVFVVLTGIWCFLTYTTVTYYSHYETLTIPVTLSNWSLTENTINGSIYGIHEPFAHQTHDIFVDISVVNNEKLMDLKTMTTSIVTGAGSFGRILHIYPHNNIVWWSTVCFKFWISIISSHNLIVHRQLMMSDVVLYDLMEPISNNTEKHVTLFCGPQPCNTPSLPTYKHINTMMTIGKLQLQNFQGGIWPDIYNIDVIIVPTFVAGGIHTFIHHYPILYFVSMFIFNILYTVGGFYYIVRKYFYGCTIEINN
jgi:hypothetical protein